MTEKNLAKIESDIKILGKDIAEIKDLLKKINTKIENDVVVECQKMSTHINFIENIYENIKAPFWYICNKINSFYLSSNSSDNKIYTLNKNGSLHIKYIDG